MLKKVRKFEELNNMTNCTNCGMCCLHNICKYGEPNSYGFCKFLIKRGNKFYCLGYEQDSAFGKTNNYGMGCQCDDIQHKAKIFKEILDECFRKNKYFKNIDNYLGDKPKS